MIKKAYLKVQNMPKWSVMLLTKASKVIKMFFLFNREEQPVILTLILFSPYKSIIGVY